MTIDPRKDFLADAANAKQWLDVADSRLFRDAVKTALLLLQRNLPRAQDMGQAAANAMRMQGATELADLLTNLADQQKPNQNPIRDHLNPVT